MFILRSRGHSQLLEAMCKCVNRVVCENSRQDYMHSAYSEKSSEFHCFQFVEIKMNLLFSAAKLVANSDFIHSSGVKIEEIDGLQ